MVTRKPLSENAVDSNNQHARPDMLSSTGSGASADEAWRQEPDDGYRGAKQGELPPDVPDVLRPGGTANSTYSHFEQDEENVWSQPGPETGTVAQMTPAADLAGTSDTLKPGGAPALRPETNPFKRKPTPESSQDAMNVPPMPIGLPPQVPTGSFSQLSVSETSNNPWQPALDEKRRSPGPAQLIPASSDPEYSRDVWLSPEDLSEQPLSESPSATLLSNPPPLISLGSEEEGSAAWDEVASTQQPQKQQQQTPGRPPAPITSTDEEVFQDSHAWDDVGSRDKGKALATTRILPNLPTETTGEGWNLVDDPASGQLSKRSTWENFVDAEEERASAAPGGSDQNQGEGEKTPPLPTRPAVEAPSQSRPADQTETYQIKNVSWHDVDALKNPRISPILIQNANGPCPLVALVNALTLTTPAETNTALVETLRSREHVSLGLLLDAVFDELMSPRRTSEDSELPDVTDLYAFLKGLHTGMNVNPRFIPTPEIAMAYKRTSLTHLHPIERGDLIPGTFEHTREMKLYSAFSIPLIHGWIPPKDDPTYDAFKRQAESYEDVQNLLFREEELEEKLSSPSQRGLSEEEQGIYQDILIIKSFLSISATQLTPWGLEVITKAVKPGTVAILFRNDHFATLYRHPQTLNLLVLVTDEGYAGHDEVVWETLVDVNGERSEFFSGDFRVVGGVNQPGPHNGEALPGSTRNENEWPAVGAATGSSSSWATVQNRRSKKNAAQEPPRSPILEQEDRDLALALQLQEEEDERQREAEVRRKRESLLSEQYIEQQARQSTPIAGPRAARGGRLSQSATTVSQRRSSNGVAIPITTSANNTNSHDRTRSTSVATTSTGRAGRVVQNVRPLVPPVTHRPADDGADDAPPSYEHAARQAPYTPPAGHPSHAASSPTVSTRGSTISVATSGHQ